MIDRKALWICLFLVFAMIAATLWRLSLLADWHHVPADGPGSHTIPVLRMFVPPVIALLMTGFFFARKWLRSGPEDAVQSWRRYNGLSAVFMTGIMTLAQSFLLARSLGALQSVDRLMVSHVVLVATGIFMMVIGNMLPKMPRLSARFRPLDPWQWNRHLRFAGKLTVALGLFMAVGLPLLPVKMVLPASFGLALTSVAASFWHRTKVKREPSPQL